MRVIKNDPNNYCIFEHNSLICCVLRMPNIGYLNGYVSIPNNHPLFEKDYDEIDIDIYGGLTFSGKNLTSYYKELIDSVVKFETWWIGFDTVHNYVHRDMNYVIEETKKMAEQLAQYTPDNICSKCNNLLKELPLFNSITKFCPSCENKSTKEKLDDPQTARFCLVHKEMK